MSAGAIIGYTYLFITFIALRFIYPIVNEHLWDGDDEVFDHLLSFLLTFVVTWFWPLLIFYGWTVMNIPSREVRRARKRARTAQALAKAEQELADATHALERATGHPYDDMRETFRRFHR